MKCLLGNRMGNPREVYFHHVKVSNRAEAHGAQCTFCDGLLPDHGPVPVLINDRGQFGGGVCALCLVRSQEWYTSTLIRLITLCRSAIADMPISLDDCSAESSKIDELDAEAGMLSQWCTMLANGIGLDEVGLGAFLSSNGISLPVRGVA